MTFDNEAVFEAALINLLTEKYGWEPEILRYPTEETLVQNWKQILFENNCEVDRLNDVPLTDSEMQQVLDQIAYLRTPLKLNGFINGKTISIKRDNPADQLHLGKEVSLKIYDSKEIAAGQSRYQIAQQPVFKARSGPLREFCVSDFRQNQEYHVINVHDGGLFPLSKFLPVGWDGMRAACGVNAGAACRGSYFRGISLPCGQRT